MKLANLYLALFFLTISLSNIEGQIYKKFSFEIGVNRSVVINTKEIVSFQQSGGLYGKDVNISKESPSFSNNYSLALKYKLFDRHLIGIRYAHNTLGSLLTGDIKSYNDVGYGLIELKNSLNIITSKSWGIIYEYQLPISKGNILFDLGLERQSNSFDDSFVIVSGISSDNYTTHAAIGYIYPISKYTSLHSKIFATQSLTNNSTIVDLSESAYVPLQIGLEFGIRFQLNNY